MTFTDDANNEETLTSAATEVVQQGSNAWSATMTVETRNGFTGYSYWGDPHLGSLSATEIEWDGKTHYVRYIFLKDGELRLGLNEEMFSTGFVLSVGDEEFGSADAMVDKGGASYRFRWDDPGLGWSDGDEVTVNLVQSDQNTPALGGLTIIGTAQAEETLTADTSGIQDADGLTSVSYSYQWIRNDGTTDTDIENATGATYTLDDDDVGKAIKVRVTFTDDRGNEEMLTSEVTAEVFNDTEEVSEEEVSEEEEPEADTSDDTLAAEDLGTLSPADGETSLSETLTGTGAQESASYSFTLEDALMVTLVLDQLDYDADLLLEDEDAQELYASEEEGTTAEEIERFLPAGELHRAGRDSGGWRERLYAPLWGADHGRGGRALGGPAPRR